MTPKQKKRLRVKRRHHNQPGKGKRNNMQVGVAIWRPSYAKTVSWTNGSWQ